MTLPAVVLLLSAALPVVGGSAFGSASAQQPSPSASPSFRASPSPGVTPGPTGPAIKLLNPSTGYEPGLDPTGEDPPKISDKYDGVDESYQIVAAVASPPSTVIVEASFRYANQNEIVIGELGRVGTSNIWELSWDVPQSLDVGAATLQVGLYAADPNGLVELARDSVDVEMRHKGDDVDSVADETTELLWPQQASQIGFHKPRNGQWRAVVEAKTPTSTSRLQAFYSTSPAGTAPKFTSCGTTATSSFTPTPSDPLSKIARFVCTLAGSDLPSAVTAVAIVALDGDTSVGLPESQESADVHGVNAYVQSPDEMTVTMPAWARGLTGGCIAITMLVNDHLGRPVQGANVDIHATGPDDQLTFGSVPTGFGQAAPDRGSHEIQPGSNCVGAAAGQQGLHRRPGMSDTKHRESTTGSNLGRFSYQFFSRAAGVTELTAWVDDEEIETEAQLRPVDSDELEGGEPSVDGHLQWYGAAPTLQLDPSGATGALGECVPYLVKARSATQPLREVNVDLHAQSELESVRFCTPVGGAALRAPEGGNHSPLDPTQSTDGAVTTPTMHAEAETDDAGNLLFGVTAPVAGDASITAWIDGERGPDNDVMDAADPRVTGTVSWADCTSAGHASFVSPSAFGSGTTGPGDGTSVSTKLDADEAVHVVVRSDCPSFAQGVEIQLANGSTFRTLGNATRIGQTDTYEFFWTPVPADGSHRLRAHVVGAPADEEQTVTVNAQDATGGNPTEQADETIELTKPGNGTSAPFIDRATEINGIASEGAEGVDLFYTKISARDTPAGADWIACGFVDLDGTSAGVQPFAGSCKLRDPDQPSQVTAIAALSVDCGWGQAGCDAAPDADARGLPTFKKDSGDAHRVFGFEGLPFVSIDPAENEAQFGRCVPFTLSVADDSSQAMPGENVDIHLKGPQDGVSFCSPEGGSQTRPPTEGGHGLGPAGQSIHADASGADTYHIEGETDPEGRFTFGVSSDAAGDSEITAWLDRTDDDFPAIEETSDTSLMHWIAPQGCTIVGTSGPDRLRGDEGADRICGRGGNDVVAGLGGNDVLLGGAGNDRLSGGSGDDVVSGGPGHDRLRGNAGRDRCNGGPQRDVLETCERDAPTAAPTRHL